MSATAPAAENDIDLLSVLIHEFGHSSNTDSEFLPHGMRQIVDIRESKVMDLAREELFANADLLAEVLS